MKEKIHEILKQIEAEKDIKIIYACEAGSRAWGYSNENSDFDVRFIYIHRPCWYLTIDRQKDVIELPVNNLLDVNGWDLQKCLKLYRKSNPSVLEYIHSRYHYMQPFSTVEKLRKHTQDVFSQRACFYHYLHMAQKNAKKQMVSNEVKHYLNVLRPLLAAKWIETYKKFPPVDFTTLVEKTALHHSIKAEIASILAKKRMGEKKVTNITLLHEFFECEIKRLMEDAKNINETIENPTPLLNGIFLDTLYEVWGIKLY
ncbi:nucleotidyltransferase domain-containing protein [uncultured Metabacillus sp.]|uniref:nucleotidyltransferase domain-containing protein n=1 Tax=uncultured Metabacillus sp. TaxID=2860135 RepID=UPI00261E64EB|nr:nucleotidyltransferase domain-containing protein [uncultured Metabacillus sp.]